MPFDNRLVFATMKGSELLKVLEHSVSGDIAGGRYLEISGLKVAYDRQLPANHRLVDVKAFLNGKWEPVQPDKTYKIAVNDFTFKGGEGYDFSAATDIVKTEKRLSIFLMNYLIKNKKVCPEPGTRLFPRQS